MGLEPTTFWMATADLVAFVSAVLALSLRPAEPHVAVLPLD
jgi:hypothetical protein